MTRTTPTRDLKAVDLKAVDLPDAPAAPRLAPLIAWTGDLNRAGGP